jgi:hypothetical protein
MVSFTASADGMLQSGKENHTFLQFANSSVDAGASALWICKPISPDIVARSKILTDLFEFNGFVTLPKFISEAKFWKWHDFDHVDELYSISAEASMLQVCPFRSQEVETCK